VLHAPHSYHYKLNENNVRILAIGQTVWGRACVITLSLPVVWQLYE
jgi:hypothetical protein